MATSFAIFGIEFEEYWKRQLRIIFDNAARGLSPQDSETLNCFILPRLKMTREKFEETFIQPWKELDFRTAQQIAALLSDYSNRNCHTPFEFQIKPKEDRELRALEWLTVLVNELNLNEFEAAYSGEMWISTSVLRPNKLTYFNKKPYKQCHFCGRLDRDAHGNEFTGKVKFCHENTCPSDSSNPKDHEGCCYGQWALIKKTLRQKIDRIVKKNPDNKDQEIHTVLNDFHHRMFDHGKTLSWDVRDQDEYDTTMDNEGGQDGQG